MCQQGADFSLALAPRAENPPPALCTLAGAGKAPGTCCPSAIPGAAEQRLEECREEVGGERPFSAGSATLTLIGEGRDLTPQAGVMENCATDCCSCD